MVQFHPTRRRGAEGHLISSFFGLALIYVKPLDHLLLISLELRMLITRMAIPIKWQQFPAYNLVGGLVVVLLQKNAKWKVNLKAT
jgi:hypothetical protein